MGDSSSDLVYVTTGYEGSDDQRDDFSIEEEQEYVDPVATEEESEGGEVETEVVEAEGGCGLVEADVEATTSKKNKKPFARLATDRSFYDLRQSIRKNLK